MLDNELNEVEEVKTDAAPVEDDQDAVVPADDTSEPAEDDDDAEATRIPAVSITVLNKYKQRPLYLAQQTCH